MRLKNAIETIVRRMKEESKMKPFIYATPNQIDRNAYLDNDFPSNDINVLDLLEEEEKSLRIKYDNIFKNNFQCMIILTNTKNSFILHFVTKGTEFNKFFAREIEQLVNRKEDWMVMEYILKNAHFCIVECMPR